MEEEISDQMISLSGRLKAYFQRRRQGSDSSDAETRAEEEEILTLAEALAANCMTVREVNEYLEKHFLERRRLDEVMLGAPAANAIPANQNSTNSDKDTVQEEPEQLRLETEFPHKSLRNYKKNHRHVVARPPRKKQPLTSESRSKLASEKSEPKTTSVSQPIENVDEVIDQASHCEPTQVKIEEVYCKNGDRATIYTLGTCPGITGKYVDISSGPLAFPRDEVQVKDPDASKSGELDESQPPVIKMIVHHLASGNHDVILMTGVPHPNDHNEMTEFIKSYGKERAEDAEMTPARAGVGPTSFEQTSSDCTKKGNTIVEHYWIHGEVNKRFWRAKDLPIERRRELCNIIDSYSEIIGHQIPIHPDDRIDRSPTDDDPTPPPTGGGGVSKSDREEANPGNVAPKVNDDGEARIGSGDEEEQSRREAQNSDTLKERFDDEKAHKNNAEFSLKPSDTVPLATSKRHRHSRCRIAKRRAKVAARAEERRRKKVLAEAERRQRARAAKMAKFAAKAKGKAAAREEGKDSSLGFEKFRQSRSGKSVSLVAYEFFDLHKKSLLTLAEKISLTIVNILKCELGYVMTKSNDKNRSLEEKGFPVVDCSHLSLGYEQYRLMYVAGNAIRYWESYIERKAGSLGDERIESATEKRVERDASIRTGGGSEGIEYASYGGWLYGSREFHWSGYRDWRVATIEVNGVKNSYVKFALTMEEWEREGGKRARAPPDKLGSFKNYYNSFSIGILFLRIRKA